MFRGQLSRKFRRCISSQKPLAFSRYAGDIKSSRPCELDYADFICFQGIWNIIKGWLDPVVASKVHFTKTLAELEKFIDRSHIIEELGGDDPYTYRYIEPSPSENALLADTDTRKRLLDERAALVREYEKTTQEWIKEPALTSSSSEKQEKEPAHEAKKNSVLQEKRTELAQRLRTGYWQLDPYLRAKTLYDRLGVIREGGKIQFYDSPSSPSGSTPDNPGPISTAAVAAGSTTVAERVNNNNNNNNDKNHNLSQRSGPTAGHRDHDLD